MSSGASSQRKKARLRISSSTSSSSGKVKQKSPMGGVGNGSKRYRIDMNDNGTIHSCVATGDSMNEAWLAFKNFHRSARRPIVGVLQRICRIDESTSPPVRRLDSNEEHESGSPGLATGLSFEDCV